MGLRGGRTVLAVDGNLLSQPLYFPGTPTVKGCQLVVSSQDISHLGQAAGKRGEERRICRQQMEDQRRQVPPPYSGERKVGTHPWLKIFHDILNKPKDQNRLSPTTGVGGNVGVNNLQPNPNAPGNNGVDAPPLYSNPSNPKSAQGPGSSRPQPYLTQPRARHQRPPSLPRPHQKSTTTRRTCPLTILPAAAVITMGRPERNAR